MFELPKEDIVKRNHLLYQVAKFVSNTGYRLFSRVHIEESGTDLRKLKEENAVFLYVGLHRSLWETTGFLSCLYSMGLPIPYVGMGDNLVKGKFFQYISAKIGAFLVKRGTSRSDMIASSQKLKKYIMYYMSRGVDVCIFPEGTRRNVPNTGHYGNFFPTVFDALLDYEKLIEQYRTEHPEFHRFSTYVIPFNADYSKVREDGELTHSTESNPSTLSIFDSLKMLKHIGDIYISFDDPIKIGDNLDKSRKEVAANTHARCLQLVKILPINIVCRAIKKAAEDTDIPVTTEKIDRYITETITKLSHLKERFRGFSMEDSPAAIRAKAGKIGHEFENFEPKYLPIYHLYANYIEHYFQQGSTETDPS